MHLARGRQRAQTTFSCQTTVPDPNFQVSGGLDLLVSLKRIISATWPCGSRVWSKKWEGGEGSPAPLDSPLKETKVSCLLPRY